MEVNVTKRIVTQVWDRYCPVVVNSSGRIKADWVIVDGHQEKHPGGSYYLEWRENGRRKRLSVGRDATVAFNSQIRKMKELEARAEGLEVQEPKDHPNRFQLRSAMADFLEEIKLSRQDKTWQGYKVSFTYFQQSCDKKCVDEIQRIDLLRFCAFLRDRKKLAPRTVFNKFTCVMTFLEAQGLPKLRGKNDRPRYVETEVEIFEDDQLTDLYRVCSLYHRMLYDFLLMTGFREQEAMYITWENVRFGANIVEMRWKPQFHWSPKAYKEREVPVPDELLVALEIYRKSLPARRAAPAALVFSTRSGRPDTHMIRALKRNANKAALNPEDFWLHKFRATFATTHLRAGVDLKTVMAWMIAAFIDVESRWNPRAVSAKGAMGIMQLMPATAKRFGALEPFDVEQNIAAGTRYVTTLMWEFHGDLRLVAAAYYAGDRNIARKQLDYRNPDVVAYVQAVRRQYMLRKYPAVRPLRRSTP